MFFSKARELKEKGILGINKRNLSYISKYNKRSLYPLADDKIRTKKLATDAGIAVPELYGVINFVGELHDVLPLLEERGSFVIKPAHGSGGEGVLVISEVSEHRFTTVSGNTLGLSQVEHYISNVLSGLYSLGAHPDRAMIEYRVLFDPIFKNISYRGVPDVRIIVFQGFPVMAMLRLPTKLSSGRANLHQGAVGVGVDIQTGITTTGVCQDHLVEAHPDTEQAISGLTIPHWDRMLEIAARCHDLTGLGYLGVDIVLDRNKGPLVLEVNARPGLSIQIANRAGLSNRLKTIENSDLKIQDKVGFSKTNFAI